MSKDVDGNFLATFAASQGPHTGMAVAPFRGMDKLLAVIFAAAFFASKSFGAPRAQSAEECGIAADMAVVAQSLAGEGIEPLKAGAVMARIYDVAGSERGTALMKSILDAAYTRNAAAGTSIGQKFADELFAACLKSGGNMDSVLGHSL